MNLREEIDAYALGVDRPVLYWLLDRYHMRSKWSFVARCSHRRYGAQSSQTHRVWAPTLEGRVLYETLKEE